MSVVFSRSLLLALTLCAQQVSMAQQTPAEQEAQEVFYSSMSAPRQAAVCASYLPGYLNEFAPAYAAWRSAHLARITKGEALARAETSGRPETFEAGTERLLGMIEWQWRAINKPLLAENCFRILSEVRSGEFSKPSLAPDDPEVQIPPLDRHARKVDA